MAVISELIRNESDGSISFGNYSLKHKAKKSGFEHDGGSYKIKTSKEATRLECNDSFVYESVPGTAVEHFKQDGENVSFQVESFADVSITLELEEDASYDIVVDGNDAGTMKTGFGGKLSISVELDSEAPVLVEVKKAG